MEKYGTIFQSNFNLAHDKFRNLITEYYGNPTLVKIKQADNESIYIAKVNSHLLTDRQYIIATCKKDKLPLGKIKKLKNLEWIAFQTRYLKNSDVISFTYNTPTDEKFNIPLTLIKREKKITTYKSESDYPIIVSLLHDTENLYQYPNIGTLITALETFKTIVTFN